MTDNFLAEGSLSPLASIRPRRVSNEGIITLSNSAVVSTEDAPGYGSEAVRGVFVCHDGTRFVTVGSALYIITTQGFVSILAGHPDVAGFEDGQGIDARFDLPYALTMDKDGMLQVADYNNNAIRSVTRDGRVTTLAGCKEAGFADGPGEDARFEKPAGLALDKNGDLLVADSLNHAIRKVTLCSSNTARGSVSTIAGNGQAGFSDGHGQEARFNQPAAVALNKDGSLLLADDNNHAIRMLSPDGVVTTVAGSGERGFADGEGAAVKFNGPEGVAVDTNNNILVSDWGNHRIRIIREGRVRTLAGGPDAGVTDGNGATARFNMPRTIFLDQGGRLLVSEEDRRGVLRVVQAGLGPSLWMGPGVSCRELSSAQKREELILASMQHDYSALVESPHLSDVLFQVQDEAFAGHRVILSARSDYFRVLFSSGMEEEKKNIIQYNDMSAAAFRVLLRFLYCGHLPEFPREARTGAVIGTHQENDQENDRKAKELLKISDRFQASGLFEHCLAEFAQRLTIPTALEQLVWAHEYGPLAARQVAMEFVVAHCRSIKREAEESLIHLKSLPGEVFFEFFKAVSS